MLMENLRKHIRFIENLVTVVTLGRLSVEPRIMGERITYQSLPILANSLTFLLIHVNITFKKICKMKTR